MVTFGDGNWSQTIVQVGTPELDKFWSGDAFWQDPADPNYQGVDSPFTSVTDVLWFYNSGPNESPIGVSESMDNFWFFAGYGETKYPHQVNFSDGTGESGDPLGPASPKALGSATAPSPGSLALLMVGLVGLRFTRRA